MLNKSKLLFYQWNSNSLLYIHWKGNDHLIEGLNGETDLDVLLSKSDKKLGCDILKNLGFIRFYSQFGCRFLDVEDWVGFDEETGRLIHLHLHYSLISGHTGLKEYELPWTEEALKTRIQDPSTGVFIIDPNLELIALYTRLVLKSSNREIKAARNGKYKISEHFNKEIIYIKKKVDWNVVADIARRYYKDKSSEFIKIANTETLSSDNFNELFKIVSETMKNSLRYNNLSLPFRKFYFSITVTARGLMRKYFKILFITRKVQCPKDSFSIAFIGQDGSGKSTLTMEIEKWLTWKIDANRFYLGSGEHYTSTLKRITSLIARLRENNKNKIEKTDKSSGDKLPKKRKKNLTNFIIAIIRSKIQLDIAKKAYKTVCKSEKYRKNGGIPLFDRFPQTQFEGIYDGPKIADYYLSTGLDYWLIRIMAKREEKYIKRIQEYQPGLIFKLILSPEESIRRKPFEDIDIVRRKHLITEQLKFPNSTVFLVDANQEYNQEVIYIKNQIWKMFLQRQ